MRTISIASLFVFLLIFGHSVLAQEPTGAHERRLIASSSQGVISRSFSTLDPWIDRDGLARAPRSPGDADIGDQIILKDRENYRPIEVRMTQQGMWTSNAGLSERDPFSDFYSHTELGMNYLPMIAANTYLELAADYEFYRYTDHSELDFDVLDASVGVVRVFRDWNDLSAWFRYRHQRFLDGRTHNEAFTDHALELGLYQEIPILRNHLVFGGFSSHFSLDSNPESSRRHEHGVTLGYTFFPRDRIELSSYYQLSYLDYVSSSRSDFLHRFGLSLSARLTQAVELLVSGSYAVNDSNVEGGDYQVGNAGGSVSIKVEF